MGAKKGGKRIPTTEESKEKARATWAKKKAEDPKVMADYAALMGDIASLTAFYLTLKRQLQRVETEYSIYPTFTDKLNKAVSLLAIERDDLERKRLNRVDYYIKQLANPKNYFKRDDLKERLSKYTNEETWETLTLYLADQITTGQTARVSNTGRIILVAGDEEIEI